VNIQNRNDMSAEVYYSSLKNTGQKSPLDKISKLLHKIQVRDVYERHELVAVKVHFGELGNTAYLRPVFLRPVIGELKEMGAKPYLTDTNTLYVGMRTNTVDHLYCAHWNGFNYSTLQVPIVIADGLRGENSQEVELDLPDNPKIHLATDIMNADAMMVVSHFKGHMLTGIGGAIKNLSMGCASRQGKLDMHSMSKPSVDQDKCTGCKKCMAHCQEKAIEVSQKAYITDHCVGCSRCIAVCPEGAIKINWNASSDSVQQKMAHYAYGVQKNFPSKMLYVNVVTNVAPGCDCDPANDQAVVPDLGFLSSTDPVALDRASYDLVKKANGGKDPFREHYPKVNPVAQLDYAEEIGMGSNEYDLIEI
jgi:uncharacterized Fe-S center protein